MKRVRRERDRCHPPPAPLPHAVFRCRRCHAVLTVALAMLEDSTALGQKEGASLVPTGHYWPVPEGQDFAGHFAVDLADLVGVGYHPDSRRLIGCCGPSGADGPNRICGFGHEVGTERSDRLWPRAVYLDPSLVVAVDPDSYTRWSKG